MSDILTEDSNLSEQDKLDLEAAKVELKQKFQNEDAVEEQDIKERKSVGDQAQIDLDKISMAEIPKRRVRLLMVNPADFMGLFTKGLRFAKQVKLIEGVPEDAKLLAVAADSVRNGVMLVVQSKEYDEVPINVLPPSQLVQINFGVAGATKKKASKRKK